MKIKDMLTYEVLRDTRFELNKKVNLRVWEAVYLKTYSPGLYRCYDVIRCLTFDFNLYIKKGVKF